MNSFKPMSRQARLKSEQRLATAAMGPVAVALGAAVEGQPRTAAVAGIEPDVRATAVVVQPEMQQLTRMQRSELISHAERRIEGFPTLQLSSFSFGLFSLAEMRKIAVCKITEPDLKGPNGVNDPRMGVVENTASCSRCSNVNDQCSGHFGLIEFAKPILHPMYIRPIIHVLRSVCNSCGKLFLDRKNLESEGLLRYSGFKRLEMISELSVSASRRCPSSRKPEKGEKVIGCQRNPIFVIDRVKKMGGIVYTTASGGPQYVMSVEQVDAILSGISEEDAELLGFQKPREKGDSYPARMVMKGILVAPPISRPYAVQDNRVMHHHMTTMYAEIVRINNRIRDLLDAQRGGMLELDGNAALTMQVRGLNMAVNSLMNGPEGGSGARGSKEFQSVSSMLKGKEGLPRRFLGKRVNFSARTVAGPAPDLHLSEVGIPEIIANTLTIPETVSNYNRDSMQALLRNGKVKYIRVGKNSPDQRYAGARIQVRDKIRTSYTLAIGDVVERTLRNGDVVLVNRQPTLHLQSMMGFRVRIMAGRTARIPLPVTRAFNADFDGDEINIHVPQGLLATSEVSDLANVGSCLMNAQVSAPMIGPVMDAITGCYLLTLPGVYLDGDDYSDCLMAVVDTSNLNTLSERLEKHGVGPICFWEEEEKDKSGAVKMVRKQSSVAELRAEGKPIPPIGQWKYSGKALFSALLPEDFNYEASVDLGGRIGRTMLRIRDGILLEGTVTKSVVGISGGSITQVIFRRYGQQKAMDFITGVSWVIDNYLTKRGFTVGLADCIIPTGEPGVTRARVITEAIERARLSADALEDQKKGVSDPLELERIENQIVTVVNGILGLGTRLTKETFSNGEDPVSDLNNLVAMINSGAKGSISNLTQITASVGQQFLHGRRPLPTLSEEKNRCLPYFPKEYRGIEALGFCSESFTQGLTPAGLFFSQYAGREGLTNTAITTAETGWMHHKLVRLLQDLQATADGSVRNATGVVFQFLYGDDAFNASRLQMIKPSVMDSTRYPSFIDMQGEVKSLNAMYGF